MLNLDYAVYRDRYGRLQAMPLRDSWDDAQIHRYLQDRERNYSSPIAWDRVVAMPSADAAIDVVFEHVKAQEPMQQLLKRVPPSERHKIAREIIILGKSLDPQYRVVHAASVPAHIAKPVVRESWPHLRPQ